MNIRNYRRRPNLAPKGSGQQDTPPLRRCQDEAHGAAGSPLAGFKHLPPLRQQERRLGDAVYGPGGKGVLQASKTRASSPGEEIPRTTAASRPWSVRDAAAQPGTGSVTKGSANRCLLRLCSTLLSPARGFF